MVCKACGTSFEPKHPGRAVFCSGRCRVNAWRARKVQEAVEKAVEAALADAARRVLHRGTEESA